MLQKLLKNTKFQDFSIKKLEDNLEDFLQSLSSVIFSTKLITEINDETRFKFIEKALEKDSNLVNDQNNFVRVLVSYFSILSDDSIKNVFKHLKKHIWNLLNDKFGNYILQKVIERNVKPYKTIIENLCLKHLLKLIQKKHPRYIIFKLIEADNTGKFSEKLFFNMAFKVQENFKIEKRSFWKNEISCVILLALFKIKPGKLKKLYPKFVELILDIDVEAIQKQNMSKNNNNLLAQCKNSLLFPHIFSKFLAKF